MFRITRAERSSIRTAVASFYKEATWNAADLVETSVTDYAHFVASVMRNEGLSPAIAAQRLVMTRDWTTEDARKQVCAHETPGTPCHISAGMGLGWQIIIHNGATIVDHSGSDAGVNTFAFFIPSKHVVPSSSPMAKTAPRSLARSSCTLLRPCVCEDSLTLTLSI
ncbi:MAG: hypothetical protein WA869_19090 [Alloacidobacterium sp.]|jgi:hypothetical protein